MIRTLPSSACRRRTGPFGSRIIAVLCGSLRSLFFAVRRGSQTLSVFRLMLRECCRSFCAFLAFCLPFPWSLTSTRGRLASRQLAWVPHTNMSHLTVSLFSSSSYCWSPRWSSGTICVSLRQSSAGIVLSQFPRWTSSPSPSSPSRSSSPTLSCRRNWSLSGSWICTCSAALTAASLSFARTLPSFLFAVFLFRFVGLRISFSVIRWLWCRLLRTWSVFRSWLSFASRSLSVRIGCSSFVLVFWRAEAAVPSFSI